MLPYTWADIEKLCRLADARAALEQSRAAANARLLDIQHTCVDRILANAGASLLTGLLTWFAPDLWTHALFVVTSVMTGSLAVLWTYTLFRASRNRGLIR